MKPILTLCAVANAIALTTAHAGVRSSANYEIPTEAMIGGGGLGQSQNYGSDVAISGPCGTGTGRPPLPPLILIVNHGGPVPQRPTLKHFIIATPAPSIDEGATWQLAATGQYDDDTYVDLTVTGARWSATSPLVISPADGSLRAEAIYGDALAEVRATYLEAKAVVSRIRVVNIASDNFGSYAGDGLNDAWQVRNFGFDSPNAAPLADPDGDGQDNRFENAAGTSPTNAASRFELRIDPVPGHPDWRNLTFTPWVSGRSYQLQHRPTLTAGFTPSGRLPITTNGNSVVITDTNATGAVRFYRVRITP